MTLELPGELCTPDEPDVRQAIDSARERLG